MKALSVSFVLLHPPVAVGSPLTSFSCVRFVSFFACEKDIRLKVSSEPSLASRLPPEVRLKKLLKIVIGDCMDEREEKARSEALSKPAAAVVPAEKNVESSQEEPVCGVTEAKKEGGGSDDSDHVSTPIKRLVKDAPIPVKRSGAKEGAQDSASKLVPKQAKGKPSIVKVMDANHSESEEDSDASPVRKKPKKAAYPKNSGPANPKLIKLMRIGWCLTFSLVCVCIFYFFFFFSRLTLTILISALSSHRFLVSAARELGLPIPPSRLRCDPAKKMEVARAYLREKGLDEDALSLTKQEITSWREKLDREKELAALDSANIISSADGRPRRRAASAAMKTAAFIEEDVSSEERAESGSEGRQAGKRKGSEGEGKRSASSEESDEDSGSEFEMDSS